MKGIKIVDPAAALRKADRGECMEFALLAVNLIVLFGVTYVASQYAEENVGFYLAIAFIAAGGSVYRAHKAWRDSKLPSLERTRMEELRLREEQEAAEERRHMSWAERIAKSETAKKE